MLGILLACTPKPAPTVPEAAKVPETVAVPAGKEGWEIEWEKVQREAKKEGKLVLYTDGGTELRIAWVEALKKYGISLETVSGRPAEFAERLFREKRAGLHNADFFITGLDPLLPVIKPAGVLVPLEPLLILPEVRDPKMWYQGELNFIDKDKMVLTFAAYIDQGIHINTDMVKPGDINTMQELLSPRWKGKITMDDPTVAGRGQQWMTVVAIRQGEQYLREFAKQEPVITRDRRQLIDWLAKGKYAIALGVRTPDYHEYKSAGAPITNIPLKEVSYLLSGIGNISYIDKAPHPNASMVFLNWLLSREGQIIWQQMRNDQSARVDTPVDHLIKSGDPIRQPGVDYYDTRSEVWTLEIRQGNVKLLNEIFGPLMR